MRPLTRLRAAAALAAIAIGPSCAGEEAGAPPPAVRGVVLICLDTLRADAVESMPRLSAFAGTATRFSGASSSSSWTAPSVATLLTGLLPAQTGVRGPYKVGNLVPSVTTLAEALRERGWGTVAMTAGGWLHRTRGYEQGFDVYGEEFDKQGPEASVAAWNGARAKDRSFFLFVHTLAAHDPYGRKPAPPATPERRDALAAEARQVLGEADFRTHPLSLEAGAWLVEKCLLDDAARTALGSVVPEASIGLLWDRLFEWLDGIGRGSPQAAALAPLAERGYRAGLAFADEVFGRTMDALAASALPADTVVAVVSDHGELLGEHGTLSHGRWLHEELVRVPLFLRAPGALEAGEVPGSCGLVDVAPTLLELVGAPPLPAADGRSLVPLARGKEAGHPVYAEEERAVPRSRERVMRLASARTESAKYVVTFDRETGALESEELYDLRADPRAKTPREATAEAIAALDPALCRAVERLRARVRPTRAPAACGAEIPR